MVLVIITLEKGVGDGRGCLLRLGEEDVVVAGSVRAQFRIRWRGRVPVQRDLAVAVALGPHLKQHATTLTYILSLLKVFSCKRLKM